MCKTRHAFHGGLCGTRTLSRNVCAHCGVCTLPEAAEFWGLSGQAGRPRVPGVEWTGLGQCRAGAPVTAAAPLRCPCPLPSSGADVGDRGRTFEPPRLARNSRCPGKARLPCGWPCVLRGSLSCWYPSARPSPRSRWPRSASPAGSEGSPPATASGSLCHEGREKPPAESGAAKALMMPVEGSGRGPRAPATHRRAGTRVGPQGGPRCPARPAAASVETVQLCLLTALQSRCPRATPPAEAPGDRPSRLSQPPGPRKLK